jgi:hypothetical protein
MLHCFCRTMRSQTAFHRPKPELPLPRGCSLVSLQVRKDVINVVRGFFSPAVVRFEKRGSWLLLKQRPRASGADGVEGRAARFRNSQLFVARCWAWNGRSENCPGLLLGPAAGPSLASEELSALLADISSEALACGDILCQALVVPKANSASLTFEDLTQRFWIVLTNDGGL